MVKSRSPTIGHTTPGLKCSAKHSPFKHKNQTGFTQGEIQDLLTSQSHKHTITTREVQTYPVRKFKKSV